MIGISVWDEHDQCYHVHTFTVRFNEAVTGELDDEIYWLPHWGVNPFIASEGLFAPEWN